MHFYDPEQSTLLTVDASPTGLGAILSNTDSAGNLRNVAYASRSLTEVDEYIHFRIHSFSLVIISDVGPLEIYYSLQKSTFFCELRIKFLTILYKALNFLAPRESVQMTKRIKKSFIWFP